MAISDALDPSGYGYAQDPNAQPAADPVALEENKSKWRTFLNQFNDPNVRQAVLATGIGLMRSPQYGQNAGDIGANALQSGVQTLQSLRNMDYAKQQTATARKDKLTQQGVENTQGQARIDIARAGENTNERAQTSTEANQQAIRQNAEGILSETTRHNKADEATNAVKANADMVRARATATTGARVPAEVQKINMLSAQYMTEGMDETSARAKAVMVVDSAKGATSPGEQAMNLFNNSIKNWQNDINNFGKSLTQEQIKQMQHDAINTVMNFQQFNSAQTGVPPTPAAPGGVNSRVGVIDRSATSGSPVGTVKSGYKKTKVGPDSDKTTWTKVANGNPK
jgi:hypothetical protein